MNLQTFLDKSGINKIGTSPKNVDDLFNIGSSDNNNKKGIDSDLTISNNPKKNDDTFIITYINDIIIQALGLGASDIHIEPTENALKIRFRVDGNFIKYKEFPIEQKDSFIARIKIMSYLRIDEHRLPQDGKINYKLFAGKTLDLRVSIIPTIYGEKCVIRILKKDSKPPELKELGIMPYNMVKIKKHLQDNYGMILAVGPTGSGKSTTLFSLLSQFDAEKNNISTLEDPVEYRIPGVNHTQINAGINFSFANGLRSLLRQDPDIIMVGEIRDEETAKLAIEASITGHIVFSTLHTNSAVHTIQRLVNLGIDPLLITSSLRFIISQRLGRKLCIHCKESYKADDRIKEYIVGKVGRYIKNKEDLTLYRQAEFGCDKCNKTGYKGRVGFYEVLEMTDKMEELILKGANKNQLEIQAVGDGMFPIKEDALIKVVLGETSLEEVISVIGN
ncbi:MAG: GspE/PulE family protein [Candidatus Gracilibacteria bacterium]